MRRTIRSVSWLCGASLLLAACSVGISDDAERAPTEADGGYVRPRRPNVLVVVTDDQRANGTLKVMPAVGEIFRAGGTRFPNAYSTTPLCCPARASIMTGQYAHSHEVRNNVDSAKLDQRQTLQRYLQDAGYRTAVAGKYLNQWEPERDPPYFDRWAIPLEVGYQDLPFNIDGELQQVEEYTNDLIGRKALEYLDEFEADDGAPWLLYVGTPAAHALYEPEPSYRDAPLDPWHGNPAINEKDLSDKPPVIAEAGERYGARRVRRLQLRTLMSADDLVAEVFERLTVNREARDTLAIFLSDNGQMWGDHGITGKRAPYLGSISVPLMVRWPGRVAEGKADPRIAATVDIAPTVLNAVDLPVPPAIEGRDLLSDDVRSRLLLEHWNDIDSPIPDWASLLTRRFQYVEYYEGGRTTFREYFELKRDPWQLTNLLGDDDPSNDPAIGPLERRLASDRTCRGSRCP